MSIPLNVPLWSYPDIDSNHRKIGIESIIVIVHPDSKEGADSLVGIDLSTVKGAVAVVTAIGAGKVEKVTSPGFNNIKNYLAVLGTAFQPLFLVTSANLSGSVM